jgi:glutathione peroxidase-family protein
VDRNGQPVNRYWTTTASNHLEKDIKKRLWIW